MTDYNSNNFNRILIFKPQKDMTYIRKLSMSYGYYVALAIADRKNYVTHIGVSNSFQIIPYEKLNDYDKDLLGYQKCVNLNSDDLMSVYSINSALELSHPYKLLKDCRGMRYTLPEENYFIKREVLSTLDGSNVPVDVEYKGSYTDIFSEQVVLDLDDICLDEDVRFMELDAFNSLGASGQTKLF